MINSCKVKILREKKHYLICLCVSQLISSTHGDKDASHISHASYLCASYLDDTDSGNLDFMSKQTFLKTASLFKVSMFVFYWLSFYQTVICCLSVCLSVCLSGENVPRARGLWSLWGPAKSIVSKWFRKGKASALFPRTKMHKSDWRTKRDKMGTDAQILIVNEQTNYVEKSRPMYWNNTTSRSCCCQKICSGGVDCRSGKVPHVHHVPRGSTEDIPHYFTFSHHYQGSIAFNTVNSKFTPLHNVYIEQ